MSLVKQLIRELLGMFAGDARLSLMVLAVAAAAAALSLAGAPLTGGAVLLAGSLAALFDSILRMAQRS